MPDPDAGHARYAGECECKQAKVGVKLLAAAGFRNVTNTPLESFEFRLLPGGEETILLQAQYMSRKFVENYPVETGAGVSSLRAVWVGNTHLAIGILRSLTLECGTRGVFCDYRELLNPIKNSYNPQVATTEMEILGPNLDCEVLVLDELWRCRAYRMGCGTRSRMFRMRAT